MNCESESELYVSRTCTEVSYGRGQDNNQLAENRQLACFREKPAYILLGDPGAGKTASFKYESEQPGCRYVKARDFIVFDEEASWENETLFIDGLDEVRAGNTNGFSSFDKIRKKLKSTGCLSFRISCREADWFGASDGDDLKAITVDNKLTVLHLDPLNEDDIKKIVLNESASIDFDEFISRARHQNFIPLFGNPFILSIFIKAVSRGNWPENRKQAYEMACNKMAEEHNSEHRGANRQCVYTNKQIMDTAGKLDAHILISGIEGFALSPGCENEQYPYFEKVVDDDAALIEHTLKSKLFSSCQGGELREPVHRSVAGYLSAMYLDKLIDDQGLSSGRVLALMTSSDGGVVSPLRELYAWLSSINVSHRESLLLRDPFGIVLYGDVTAFSTDDKKILLDGLYREAQKYTGFRNENWARSPFGAIATADMEGVFLEHLSSPSRDPEKQSLIGCILDAMVHGVRYPALEESLWKIVEDYTWLPDVRESSLRVLFKHYSHEEGKETRFIQLLDDLENGVIEDRQGNLSGILLSHLYPRVLSAGNVLKYLHDPEDETRYSDFNRFWQDQFVCKSSSDNVAEALDVLSRDKVFENNRRYMYFYDFIVKLVISGLRVHGDEVKTSRLYDWFGLILDKHGSELIYDEDDRTFIQMWINERSDIYKSMLIEAVGRLSANSDELYQMKERLFGAKEPDDIGYWYLEQAVLYKDEKIANEFFKNAVVLLQSYKPGDDFSLDYISTWVEINPEFKECFSSLLVMEGEDFISRLEISSGREKRNHKKKEREAQWMNGVIKYKYEIREGTAPLSLFYDIYRAYSGRLIEAHGDTPHDRVKSMFPGRQDMYEASIEGLKNIIKRSDYPTMAEVLKAHMSNKSFYIGGVLLASLNEIYKNNPVELDNLTELQIRYIILFYFIDLSGNNYEWIEYFIKKHPDIVEDVFIQYVVTCLKAGKDRISGLHQLAYDNNWSKIASDSSVKILKSFPVRAKSSLIYNLDYLLKSALKYSPVALLPVVENKLKSKSMNIMQRSRWLITALLLKPEEYENEVFRFLSVNPVRIEFIAVFLVGMHGSRQYDFSFPESTLALLTENLGGYYRPWTPDGASEVTLAMETAHLISDLLNKLAGCESSEATDQLERLAESTALLHWKEPVSRALYLQRKLIRDIVFEVPSIDQVRKTLANKEPANAADLMAITLSHLNDLANCIRDGDTDDYKQFWNTGKDGAPTNPKVENICRDVLLSKLKSRLAPLKIDAIREGVYADDKRADIRVSYNDGKGFNVPVEIKRGQHGDVWTALWEQLIKQYTRNPGAQGYGIYLVFWFGVEGIKMPPSGKKPKSALALEDRLLSLMSEEEKKLIGLCVIDCSRPQIKP